MRRALGFYAAALLVFAVCNARAESVPKPYLIDTRTSLQTTLEEVVIRAKAAKIIVFGENHFSREDHEAQFLFLRRLKESGAKLAVAHEMLPFRSQEVLDRFVAMRATEEEFYAEFTRISSPVFYPEAKLIFRYCQENAIPLLGLRAETKALYKLFFDGYKSMTPAELEELPGYDPKCSVPRRYAKFMEMFAETTPPFNYVGHKDPNTCQFYMGLDSVMATLIGRYAAAHPDTTVLAFTGALHAWKHGIPSHLAKHTDAPVLTIFPSTQSEVNIGYNLTFEDTDIVWWHFEEK